MRYAFLIVSLLLTVAAAIVAFTNNVSVSLNLFGSETHTSLQILDIAFYVIGLLIPLSLFGIRHRQNASSSKHLEVWQKQDAKLVAEISSDREKQLEAKVATLEAALKSALKKG